MTEEKQEQPQFDAAHHIKVMVDALKLAETATDYTPGNDEARGNIISGSGAVPNTTLMGYIEKAKQIIVERNKSEIIKEAAELLRAELDQVREVLG